MKLFKRILLVLLVIFLVMQAFRPAKNSSNDTSNDISKSFVVPANVKVILAKACNDCHSNSTRYPWYAEVQPVSWWLASHVKDGKRKLNFNEFDKYRVARQYEKLEECIKEVRDGGMPLPSYTLIHKDAILTKEEKEILFNWCEVLRDGIKATNPADSLVIKRK
ncbi:MAG: cytochrome [Sediminibacterium sp.]|nr:cytochrome [Sediminibacterium sp.]